VRARILKSFLDEEHRKWWTLVAVAFGLFMIMLDNTVVNVALKSIQLDLHMSTASLEWIVNAYFLTFAVLMISGGKLADLLGRRRVFIAGLVVFTLSSLACGLATSGGMLIAFRAVQGVGSAMMNPATLSIITATFPPKQRGTAMGIWVGVSASALALGPITGGLFSEYAHWSWIFFVNVPIGVLAIAVARIVIRETRDTSQGQRLDPLGLVTSGGALFALTYALIEANSKGWTSAEILGLFGAFVVLLAAFVFVELRQRAPMLDLSLFKNRTFTGANTTMLLVALSMFGVFFFVSLFVQEILGYSPVRAGLAFLPMTLCIIFFAPVAGKLSDRIGSRWLMSGGLLLVSASLLLFSLLDQHSDFWNLLPALAVGGLGMAMAMTPTASAAMSSVSVDKAGVGSGVLNSMRQIGGSLGVAVMGAILGTYVSVGPGNPLYPGQFSRGFSSALHVAAGIAFVAAIVAFVLVRRTALQAEGAPAFEAG
jgi:EmrB/QacA subfamily drug resistance transporter